MGKLFSHSSIWLFSSLFRHGALRRSTFCFSASQFCYHTGLRSQEDNVVQSLISSVEDLHHPSLKNKQSSLRSSESFSNIKGSTVDAVPVSEKFDSQSVKRGTSVLSTTESESVSRVTPMLPNYVAECNSFMSVRRQSSSQVSCAPQVQWKCCQCQRFNRIGVKKCIFCKSGATESHRKKFPPSRLITLFPPIWICEECNNRNASPLTSLTSTAGTVSNELSAQRRKFFCGKCNSPFKGVRKWTCSYCDSSNSRASPQCSSCFYERRPGWKCMKCGGSENSIFTLQCLSCKAIRPSHLSAGTQLCTLCGETNDIRSELCEHCVAPLKELQSLLSSIPLFPDSAKSETLSKVSSSCRAEGMGLPKTSRAEVPCNNSHTIVQNKPLVDTEGSWWCQNCNIVLRRNATFCDICLTPKGGTSNGKAKNGTKAPLSNETRPGDWQCPYCRQFKRMNVMSCCKKERECPAGYWLCRHCCSVNRNERHHCLGCGHVPPETTWKCKLCSSSNSVHVFACEICFSPHPLLWRCSKCEKSHHYTLSTCDCGMPKPDAPVPVLCPVCGAPNANKRKSCFRCRSRLFSDEWKCSECHYDKNGRATYRCEECLSPRPFNKEEITWVCNVCSTTVDSGGDLPHRDQCPKCNSAFTSHCLKFPSRWICKKCLLEANRSTSHTCMECGQSRALSPFRCHAVCPHCFQDTDLTEKEICSRCGESLSMLLDTAGELVQGMEALPFATTHSC